MPPHPGAAQAALARHERRPLQLIHATLLGAAVSSLANLLDSRMQDALVLQAAALLLWLARWLVQRGQVQRGVRLMLFTLTGMVTLFAWLNGGLRDVSLLVLPVILLAAGILTPRHTLLGLLLFMVVVVATLGTLQLLGWHEARLGPVNATTILDTLIVLLITAFGVHLMSGDLRRALVLLARENRRVQRSQQQLEHLVHHDALTGLPNRLLARDRFEVALAKARRQRQRVALLYLDLDHFKHVNDAHGHQAGDELLRLAAERLRGAARAGDTVCRLGGDEFLLLLDPLPDAEVAARVAGQVVELMAEPYAIAGVELHGSASLGVAIAPDDGADFDELLKHVDIAMYQAKAQGGHGMCFFDPAMNEGVREQAALLAGMRAGLARGEFQVHYQPQFSLAGGRMIGAEALLRWQHPELGSVAPSRFIAVAERSGFIVELGAWVLREACRAVASWLPRLAGDFRISVNLSPAQLKRGQLEQLLHQVLAESGLPPQRLELELTESMLLEDSRELTGTLERLRGMGLHFAIDDFGTGYSNLGYLKRFEVSRLKIDQSFVRRLTHDAHDAAIVGAIVQMARSLDLATLAEGVEDEPTRARLASLGCDAGQGWLWSRAVPASEFERFLEPQATRPQAWREVLEY